MHRHNNSLNFQHVICVEKSRTEKKENSKQMRNKKSTTTQKYDRAYAVCCDYNIFINKLMKINKWLSKNNAKFTTIGIFYVNCKMCIGQNLASSAAAAIAPTTLIVPVIMAAIMLPFFQQNLTSLRVFCLFE